MSHLNPTFHLKSLDSKSWLMFLLGGCLLVIAVSRGIDQASAWDQVEPGASNLEGEAHSGFLPMREAFHAPALPPEKAMRSGLPTSRFMSLEAAVEQADEMVSLPDGHAVPVDQIPMRLVIPAIGVNAPVVTASLGTTHFDGGMAYQWQAPDFYAAGWHYSSAPLGQSGNTVINGHHNAFGEVFRDLVNLEVGDELFVKSNSGDYRYVVDEIKIFRERYITPEEQRQNARWIDETTDERLTLVTCWPYESNSNRLLIIARPVQAENQSGVLSSP
jgi:LPXTG-site transpeptidase (sortase) family protein